MLEGVSGEVIRLETSDGISIQAWWFQSPEGPTRETSASVSLPPPGVLFLHGNAGDISHRTELARGLLAQGLSVLLLEYRGYGGSHGSPSEEGFRLDANAGYEFLLRRLGDRRRIVVFGRSMGGAVAARLAAEYPPGALILEATFTSLEEMGRSIYPFLPGFLFRRIRGRFDTRSWMSAMECPVLVVHGTRDEIVPIRMGRELLEAVGPRGVWMEIEGAGHNDVFWVGGEAYFREIAEFVKEAGRGEPR